jgi:membrane-bound ClpP family serine protease
VTPAFVVLGALGVAVLLLSLVADAGELDLPGTDVGVPAEAVGGFLAAVGAIGWLLTAGGAGPAVTVPAALGGGAAVALGTVALVRFLVRSPTDPTPVRQDFVGAIGRVVTPIRPGGVGEVLVRRHGQPWKVAAEVVGEEGELEAGAEVVVVAAPSDTRLVVTRSQL